MGQVVVYGTLRKGERANSILDKEEYLGTFKVKLPYKMISLVSYPAMIPSKQLHESVIEIYNITNDVTMDMLDAYEGFPQLYRKEETEYGTMYVYNTTQEELAKMKELKHITDWVEYSESDLPF